MFLKVYLSTQHRTYRLITPFYKIREQENHATKSQTTQHHISDSTFQKIIKPKEHIRN